MSLAAITMNGMGIGQLAIYALVVGAIIAIVFIALRQMGVSIPPFVIQIFWVVVVLLVAIFAIRLVMSM